jgi:carbon-monoxide dehydrogenase large subunit
MPYTTIAKLKFDNGDYPAAVKLAADAIDLAAVRARQKKGEPD